MKIMSDSFFVCFCSIFHNRAHHRKIMNLSHIDVNDILSLPLIPTEQLHKGRNRLGRHLFYSYFYTTFKNNKDLNEEQKQEVLRMAGIWNHPAVDADDSSYDSVDSVVIVGCRDILKLASIRWRALSEERKAAWAERAREQNRRPRVDGTVLVIPPPLLQPSLIHNLLHSISMDWKAVVSHFRSAIMRKPKNTHSLMSYKFGNERVVLYSQPYRKFHLNSLLLTTLFGSPSFSSLFPYEIAHRTAGVTIIHIASLRRASEVLTLGGLSGVIHVKTPGLNFGGCGKVILVNQMEQYVVGYIKDETQDKIHVKIDGSNENIIEINRPVYDSANGKYNILQPNFDNANIQFALSEYWPLRLKLNKSGSCSIILSRLPCNDEQSVIQTIMD